MVTKTVSVELEPDAYEKLRAAQRPGESFSAVVRRGVFGPPRIVTGADLLEYIRQGGSGVSGEYLDSVEEAIKHDPPPDDPWA